MILVFRDGAMYVCRCMTKGGGKMRLLAAVAGLRGWVSPLVLGAVLLAFAAAPAIAQNAGAGGANKRWTLSGSIGIQSDDNVTTDETDTTSNQSDEAAVFEVSGTYQLLDESKVGVGLELGYDFFQSLYDTLTDFDLQSHTFSASAEREIEGFDTGLTYLYTRTFLGGDDFLALHNLSPTLGYAVTSIWYVSLRYSYQNKDFISSDPRDADQHSGTFDNFLFFMQGKGYLSLGYRAEGEDTEGDEFDYFGHFFHARLKTPIRLKPVEQWNPVLTLSYEYSKKDFSNVTASIGDKREDTRTTIALGLSADLTERVFAKFDYEHIEAVSNLSSSDFDENVVTFSLGARF